MNVGDNVRARENDAREWIMRNYPGAVDTAGADRLVAAFEAGRASSLTLATEMREACAKVARDDVPESDDASTAAGEAIAGVRIAEKIDALPLPGDETPAQPTRIEE